MEIKQLTIQMGIVSGIIVSGVHPVLKPLQTQAHACKLPSADQVREVRPVLQYGDFTYQTSPILRVDQFTHHRDDSIPTKRIYHEHTIQPLPHVPQTLLPFCTPTTLPSSLSPRYNTSFLQFPPLYA